MINSERGNTPELIPTAAPLSAQCFGTNTVAAVPVAIAVNIPEAPRSYDCSAPVSREELQNFFQEYSDNPSEEDVLLAINAIFKDRSISRESRGVAVILSAELGFFQVALWFLNKSEKTENVFMQVMKSNELSISDEHWIEALNRANRPCALMLIKQYPNFLQKQWENIGSQIGFEKLDEIIGWLAEDDPEMCQNCLLAWAERLEGGGLFSKRTLCNRYTPLAIQLIGAHGYEKLISVLPDNFFVDEGFVNAVKNGHLACVKKLLNRPISETAFQQAYVEAVINNNMSLAKEISQHTFIPKNYRDHAMNAIGNQREPMFGILRNSNLNALSIADRSFELVQTSLFLDSNPEMQKDLIIRLLDSGEISEKARMLAFLYAAHILGEAHANVAIEIIAKLQESKRIPKEVLFEAIALAGAQSNTCSLCCEKLFSYVEYDKDQKLLKESPIAVKRMYFSWAIKENGNKCPEALKKWILDFFISMPNQDGRSGVLIHEVILMSIQNEDPVFAQKLLQTLIQKGMLPPKEYWGDRFQEAINKGLIPLALWILSNGNVELHTLGKVISNAIDTGEIDFAIELLRRKNFPPEILENLLFIAEEKGHIALILPILRNGRGIEKNMLSRTLLNALDKGNIEFAEQILLQKKFSPDILGTALKNIAEKGEARLNKLILLNGKIEARDRKEALLIALGNGHLAFVEDLLIKQINLAPLDRDDVMGRFIEQGHFELAEILLNNEKNKKTPSPINLSTIFVDAIERSLEGAEEFLQQLLPLTTLSLEDKDIAIEAAERKGYSKTFIEDLKNVNIFTPTWTHLCLRHMQKLQKNILQMDFSDAILAIATLVLFTAFVKERVSPPLSIRTD